MSEQSVTLNPGESKVVSFEATPHEAKTYQVSVNGLTGSFTAKAVPPSVPLDGGWTCSGVSVTYIGPEPAAPSWALWRYSCKITSKASVTATKTISLKQRYQYGGTTSAWYAPSLGTPVGVNPIQITLTPSAVYNFSLYIDLGHGLSYEFILEDELGNRAGDSGWVYSA